MTVAIMVRDEEPRIGRALKSVRPYVDRWVIIDTGSTDGTRAEIEAVTAGWPGTLLSRPWVDFGTNRSQLVELAQSEATDWLLMMDADHELLDGAHLAETITSAAADAIQLPYESTPKQWVSRLLRAGLPWAYMGGTHEYLVSQSGDFRRRRVDSPVIRDHADGASRADKWARDLELLNGDLRRWPADSRAWFYLGETYRGLQRPSEAIAAYEACARYATDSGELGYVAGLYAGCLLQAIGRTSFAIAVLQKANRERPARREALLQLCQIYNSLGMPEMVVALLGSAPTDRPIPERDLTAIYPSAYSDAMRDQQQLALEAAGGLRGKD